MEEMLARLERDSRPDTWARPSKGSRAQPRASTKNARHEGPIARSPSGRTEPGRMQPNQADGDPTTRRKTATRPSTQGMLEPRRKAEILRGTKGRQLLSQGKTSERRSAAASERRRSAAREQSKSGAEAGKKGQDRSRQRRHRRRAAQAVRSRDSAQAELAEAKTNQKAIADELQKMLDSLSEFETYRGVVKDAQELLKQHEQTMKQTAEAADKPERWASRSTR